MNWFQWASFIKIRENTKALEKEFAAALFQLGNRLADGLPAEIAFDKVANTMENTVSGSFFRAISANIRRLGMGVEEAIEDITEFFEDKKRTSQLYEYRDNRLSNVNCDNVLYYQQLKW